MKYILPILFLGVSQLAFSQIKEEKLVLDKKREPEVKKIEKKKTSVEVIKNYPPEEKSQNPVKYTITDVPAVSDFKTSTIQGEDVKPKFDGSAQNNYFQIGGGNYGKFLMDGNVATTLENKLEVGADVHYLQTNGLKKEYAWDSNQRDFKIGGYMNSYGEKGKFNASATLGMNDYNYYGIYALEPAADVDLKQKVQTINVNGYYDFYSNNILNDVSVKTSYLKDHFDASERQGSVLLNLSKHGVDLSKMGVVMNADMGIGLAGIKSKFELLDKNEAFQFNADLSPKVTFRKGESYFMVGSGFSFFNGKYTNGWNDDEFKNNKSYWFPKAEIQLAASKEFKFYAGIDGGLKMNSYESMLQENPYAVSDQFLKPTQTKYNFYFGLKGDLDETIKYNVSAGYAKMRDIMFFAANPLFDNNFTLNRSAYDFSNTFTALYDDGNMSHVKGSIQYFPLENLVLDAELEFAKYDLKNYEHIYNKPLFNLNIGAKYTMLEKKLLLGFKGFFMTDRTSNSFSYEAVSNPSVPIGLSYQATENTNDKVGGYVDLNLSAEYKFHKNFSIFALGNNLVGAKYQTFKGYKVLGPQILGGVKISF